MLDSKNGKIEKIMTIFSQINFRNNLFPHFWPTSEQKFEKDLNTTETPSLPKPMVHFDSDIILNLRKHSTNSKDVFILYEVKSHFYIWDTEDCVEFCFQIFISS